MAAIVPAVPAAVDGIATHEMVTACAADVASVSIAANQASPFASARRIVIVTTTGDVTAMATGATVDRRRGAGEHPALFLSSGAASFFVASRRECLADATIASLVWDFPLFGMRKVQRCQSCKARGPANVLSSAAPTSLTVSLSYRRLLKPTAGPFSVFRRPRQNALFSLIGKVRAN
jgi:hypothetical protein